MHCRLTKVTENYNNILFGNLCVEFLYDLSSFLVRLLRSVIFVTVVGRIAKLGQPREVRQIQENIVKARIQGEAALAQLGKSVKGGFFGCC